MDDTHIVKMLTEEIARRETVIDALKQALAHLQGSMGGDGGTGLKLLPSPGTEKPRKPVQKRPRKLADPQRAAHAPKAAEDNDCPLDWELGGKTFTLSLNEALLLRELSRGEEDEVTIVSQELLLDAMGRPHVSAFFASLRMLRTALEGHGTGHTIETRRGQGYVLVEVKD